MRIIGRYVFREILASAAIGTLLATFLVFLQRSKGLFDLLVQSNNPKMVWLLFAYAVPSVLPFTIPFGVLVGILIGLGRLAADGEIVAMRANGVPSRKVIAPVLIMAALGGSAAAFASLRLSPLAIRRSTDIINELARTALSAEVQPRVFVEDYPNLILYVGEVQPGTTVRWRPVFMADVGPEDKRPSALKDSVTGPITVAREAIVVSEPDQRRIQISMRDAYTYEMAKNGEAHDIYTPRLEHALYADPPHQTALKSTSMTTSQLLEYKSGPDLVENRIQLHTRFALPFACLALALVGIPLGLASHKGGRSAGYVNAVVLAFLGYYTSLMGLTKLAQQHVLPIPVAIWLPNFVFFLAGVILVSRMDRPGDHDPLAGVKAWWREFSAALKAKPGKKTKLSAFGRRIPMLPQLLDTYILSTFLLYFAILLGAFVSLTLIFTFFELMGDMVKNQVPLIKMFTYLFFLSPEIIYQTLPISVLVAVLVVFGVLAKQNELTAFKACGVSLHRLVIPILLGSSMLSGCLFAFDYYYLPGANRKQELLRDQIKNPNKPTQTYLNPERKWIMGQGSRIYYYKHFDPAQGLMADVSVFEINPVNFKMVRQIWAERARWSPTLKTWVFERGWNSDLTGASRKSDPFEAMAFPELTEPPNYFQKEAIQDKQMNFLELDKYISDLRQSGFDTVKLQVQFYQKFSVPMFAFIMALIAAPFGFMVGNRGAMTGIGVSIGIAIAYWAFSTLFEKVGGIGQLPPAIAAWSPNVIFSLAGMYMLLRVRT
jgi:LPS export ABC transporter permease LptG/LPS export ABC transporter permease LptF